MNENDTTPQREVIVRARNVHKAFGTLKVLNGVNVDVHKREVLCIMGPSGSGKSTFLRCINHLEKINAGEIVVNGHLVGYRRDGDKLYELTEKQVVTQRRDVGMVFQHFN
jgi:polar amino acid transport system ATP-binding protein